jgi:hypothetical protein
LLVVCVLRLPAIAAEGNAAHGRGSLCLRGIKKGDGSARF